MPKKNFSDKNQKQDAIALHSLQAEKFAASYADLGTNAYVNSFGYSRYRLNSWLERYLPKEGGGLRLLDVGCGTGHHLAQLHQKGFEVAGIDGSEDMLKHARANNPKAELLCGDVEKIPFPERSFDVVLCLEVLRYLPSPEICIKEIARVLKPGGICLATAMPLLNLNAYWLVNRLANIVKVGDLVRLKQYFIMSGRLRREFISASFPTPAIHGVYFGPINWVERLLPPFLPKFLEAWEPIDKAIADYFLFREFSNMFLVYAVRA